MSAKLQIKQRAEFLDESIEIDIDEERRNAVKSVIATSSLATKALAQTDWVKPSSVDPTDSPSHAHPVIAYSL